MNRPRYPFDRCILLACLLAVSGAHADEKEIGLNELRGKPCTFGKDGEKGVLVPLSFSLPQDVPPGAFSVDVLDRMRENRYRSFELDEDFWQVWISVWAAIGNKDAYDLGCDEIIASASPKAFPSRNTVSCP